MLEQTERILLRVSSVLSKVEPDLHTGSDQKVPAPQHWVVQHCLVFTMVGSCAMCASMMTGKRGAIIYYLCRQIKG